MDLLTFLSIQTIDTLIKKDHYFLNVMESLRGVRTKVQDYSLDVNEFELQSGYYIHFQTNTIRKGMKPLTPFSYELNSTSLIQMTDN